MKIFRIAAICAAAVSPVAASSQGCPVGYYCQQAPTYYNPPQYLPPTSIPYNQPFTPQYAPGHSPVGGAYQDDDED
jgi:hypothetical protein